MDRKWPVKYWPVAGFPLLVRSHFYYGLPAYTIVLIRIINDEIGLHIGLLIDYGSTGLTFFRNVFELLIRKYCLYRPIVRVAVRGTSVRQS